MFKYSDSPFVSKDLMFLYPRYYYIDGIEALGGNVAPNTLIEKYSEGLFPWYNEDDPILWWALNPRLVLFPENLIVQRSMRTYFNNPKLTVTYNTCFEAVMRSCQMSPRGGYYVGSWINEELIASFVELHRRGLAHSVEVWQDKKLAGGLYGLAFGKIFFGESMFAEIPNASKFGFISWVKLLQSYGFTLIDCQSETNHLKSLGAQTMPRSEFQNILKDNKKYPINYLHTKFS